MLRTKNIRDNTYNIYIMFLIIPDAMFCLARGIHHTFIGLNDGLLPRGGVYEGYVFLWFFYFFTNSYVNAVVAYETNRLLNQSYKRMKAKPPKPKKVAIQVTVVYLLGILHALWWVLPGPFSPGHFKDGKRGIFKTASAEGGVFSSVGSICVGFFVIGSAIAYVIYIRIRMSVKRLLPKVGRTRVLSLFFMRIIIVFILFYLPNTVLNTIALILVESNPTGTFWTSQIGGLLTALQAIINLYMISFKPDIWEGLISAYKSSYLESFYRSGTSDAPEALKWEKDDVYDGCEGGETNGVLGIESDDNDVESDRSQNSSMGNNRISGIRMDGSIHSFPEEKDSS